MVVVRCFTVARCVVCRVHGGCGFDVVCSVPAK